MSRLLQLEHEIENLPPEDFRRFRDWFANFDAARFDDRIESDAAAGRLDSLGDEALQAFRAGRTKPL